ncbi:STE-domain-containing protein [Metschnikowia bicuspidata var. bicuspidata NRRL YB-4993]|uniref:STE-domain-containing protein n=1 Tax=Metschnikowia bicuspidata var. bicuspidata NRRL YB-4993 TaxID=869754 RepID=A0A1A0HBA2_9ASCO|nr:STE-domain-containing protein [Metschnikowia bicuspidata var. bicuspidata NRRL YB-4993]OBA21409.1 STE-domain-containing protein [Metschnikowia bicuspidata var. bicuspidata NRRL YB-4993]
MSEITDDVKESLSLVEDLKFFLATAPANWQENQVIRRYYLNNDEGFVSCVFWNNLYFITGTDIVRCILYKFQHFGRTVTDRKKFEEGIFSDLRNLKAGTDSVLENPKLEFLEFLYKNSCLRTQKKQKVFFWFNVPHDKLMADALERDIKKEKANQTPTSVALREPALLFNYVEDKTKSLYDQLSEHLSQPRFDTQTAGPGAEPDDDDDFPLDYLDHGLATHDNMSGADWAGRDYAGRDYITLDSHHHSGSYMNAFDSDLASLDASVFQNSVNVVSNDDYLIEQTVPARAGNLSSSQLYYPRLAKFYDEQAFMHQPLSFGMGPQFPPSAVMTLLGPYAYDTGYHVYEPPMHPHIPFENEYLHPQLTPSGPMYPMAHVGLGHPEDFDYLMRSGIPSQRQQEISASMMKKRRQLLTNTSKVTKPPHRTHGNKVSDFESNFRVQIKKEDDLLAVMPTPEPSIHVSAYNGSQHNKNM